MKKTHKNQILNKVILLIILVGVLSAILYLSNNTNLKAFRGEDKTTIQKGKKEVSKEEKILDCSKKVAQGEDLLAGGDTDSCLFMGCGDFFQ